MRPPKEIHDVMQAYYSAKATPEQIDVLEAWLREDPANVRWFVDLGLLDGLMLSVQKDEDAAAVLAMLAESEANAEPDFSLLHNPAFDTPPPKKPGHSITFREGWSLVGFALKQALRTKVGVIGSVAAVFAIGLVLYLAIFSRGNAPDAQPIADQTPSTPEIIQVDTVATLTNIHNAAWAGPQAEGALARGSRLTPNQRLTLTAGFAQITTASGAVAILEAPATIELINDNAIHLHTGKLVGICETPSSKGFVVRTPHLDVTDLGTRFGVDATQADATEVHVFEGQVQVTRQADTGQVRERLFAGGALRSSGQQSGLHSIELRADRFSAILPDGSTELAIRIAEAGIASLSGQVQWSPMRLDGRRLEDWPSREQAVVFEELRGFVLDSDLPVTLDQPGTYTRFDRRSASTRIPQGTVVRTYILYLKPGPQSVSSRVEAALRFEGEILGVVANQEDWQTFMQIAPDHAFRPSLEMERFLINGGADADRLVLDADKHTLSFRFSVTSGMADTVRVIVREPKTPTY